MSLTPEGPPGPPPPPPMAPWRVQVPVAPQAPMVYPVPPVAPFQPVGRASSSRLIGIFIVALVIALAGAAVLVITTQPREGATACPDPTEPCGVPPVQPTPPGGRSAPPAATPVPTVRPQRSPVVASLPPIAALPTPQPPSNADLLRNGATWVSTAHGFSLDYATFWAVDSQGPTAIVLSSWQGSVHVFIEGFAADRDPAALVQEKRADLRNTILGLTGETDTERLPPGTPIVGFREGVAEFLAGTLNNPQGPTTPMAVAIVAATDGRASIRVTVVSDESLRSAAFFFADKLLNGIHWPSAG